MQRLTRSAKHALEARKDSAKKRPRQDEVDAANAILGLASVACAAPTTACAAVEVHAPVVAEAASVACDASGLASVAAAEVQLPVVAEAAAASGLAPATRVKEDYFAAAADYADEDDELQIFEANSELRHQVEHLEVKLERNQRERDTLMKSNADLNAHILRLETTIAEAQRKVTSVNADGSGERLCIKTLVEERDTLQANLTAATESLSAATARADDLALRLSAAESVLDFTKKSHDMNDQMAQDSHTKSQAAFKSLQDTNAELLRANDEFHAQREEALVAAAAAKSELEKATIKIADLQGRFENQAAHIRKYQEESKSTARLLTELNKYKAANDKMLKEIQQARAQVQQTVLENLNDAKAAGKAFASPEADAVLSIKLALEEMTKQRDRATEAAQSNLQGLVESRNSSREHESSLKIAKSRISELESEARILRARLSQATTTLAGTAPVTTSPRAEARPEFDRLTRQLKAANALKAAAEHQLAAERASTAELRLHDMRMKEIVHPTIIASLGVQCSCSTNPACPCKNFTLALTVATIQKLHTDLAVARATNGTAPLHPDDPTSFKEVAGRLIQKAIHGGFMKLKHTNSEAPPFVPGVPLVVPDEGHVSTLETTRDIYIAAKRADQWYNAVDSAALALGANIYNEAAAEAFQSAAENCFLAGIAFAETLATISPKRLSTHRASNLIAHPDFRRALLATAHSPRHFAAVATAMAALTINEQGPVPKPIDALRIRCAGAIRAMVSRVISKATIATPEDDPVNAAVNAVVVLASAEATMLPRLTPLAGPVRPDNAPRLD